MRALEITTEQDVFYDYCLWGYQPVAPHAGKLRSVNLLAHSFEVAGINPRAFELIPALRAGIGQSRTVWGVKRRGETLSWEFYFYDYRRRERERSITRVLEILRPFVGCEVRADERRPYFMFSLDIDDALLTGSRQLGEVHMYVGNVGSTVSSGICYELTPGGGSRLENFYFFFDARRQLKEITGKVACSAYLDATRLDLNRILWPELCDCRVIVVANKQHSDGIYFSGIGVDQLLFFLERMRYPAALRAFVEEHRHLLDHLTYDVGIDYRMEGDELVYLKSAYYGVF
jgi:hypothetical protein